MHYQVAGVIMAASRWANEIWVQAASPDMLSHAEILSSFLVLRLGIPFHLPFYKTPAELLAHGLALP